MAQQFGNTWWGEEWLRSLSEIDYENRIPRGASYARRGMVRDVKMKGNIIEAKVQGSRPRPYRVTIIVPPFFPGDVDRLVGELMQRPGIISRLLNRQLDPEVMEIARQCGLKIFPQRWSDLKMQCSCPDWAVPCKHIAAVVYMISREIDNNPFIVFEMHNVDLLAELEKRGLTVADAQSDVKVPTVKETVKLLSAKELPKTEPMMGRIDFSRLTDRTEPMLALLADNPPFSMTGNFKDHYASELQRVRKLLVRFFVRRINADVLFPLSPERGIGVDDEITLTFDYNLSWEIDSTLPCKPRTLLRALLELNPDFLPDYHPTVAALHQGLMLALHLLHNGAVAPQLLQLADKRYAIRWLPAYIDGQVRKAIDDLDQLIPGPVVKCRATAHGAAKPIERQGEWLVSFFIGTVLRVLTSYNTAADPLLPLFFKGEPAEFSGVGEREIPGGIKSWTTGLSMIASDWRPVFSVEENREEGFDLHIEVEDKRQAGSRYVMLRDVLVYPYYDDTRFDILRSFTIVSSLLSDVYHYINAGAEQPIHYGTQDFVPFLTQVIPIVQMLDIKVFMPRSLQELIKPKPTLKIKRDGKQKGFLSLAKLFDFEWEVALGDEIVTREEFRKLTAHAEGLIRFKSKYIYVDAASLKKMREAFAKFDEITPGRLLQVALAEEFDSAPVLLTPEVRELINELTAQEQVPLPAGLNATLRPYQERGYSWMYRNGRIGFGSVLADDMGLGKTLQAITLMLKLKEDGMLEDGKVLVVAPTGLLTNWQAEIARFAPSLTVQLYHGSERTLKGFGADILLTTYGVLRTDAAKLKKRQWTLMVIDEAQNIKNHDTAQSKAVRSIGAQTCIALSGTPVENRLTEFWSIMDYANKGYLGGLKKFKEDYANPIQLYNDEGCAARFRRITAPFMMRRMKTDKTIIADLPDKIENNDYASLTPSQAALYEKTLNAAMAEIEEIDTTDQQSLFKRQGLILQMMLYLKQICNHPAQFLKNGDMRPELSGKAQMLLDRVESIIAAGEKVLVFTQFREMGDVIVKMIEERTGQRPMFYHGGCSIKERQKMVRRFQEGRADRVFILSLKAAGTGLNLTAATHVIHYDLWWNPAVEAQATDRAYRIGQHSNVMVHRFITKDTFEERIDEMIQSKRHLADMTVTSGESWIGKLSNKELREIFG